jgi:hypothetical protein
MELIADNDLWSKWINFVDKTNARDFREEIKKFLGMIYSITSTERLERFRNQFHPSWHTTFEEFKREQLLKIWMEP